MKKARIDRITSRPKLGDTNNHVCFEQCSQSRCELNPDCIQRVKYINEISQNTTFTNTSGISNSQPKCPHLAHSAVPALGEINDTELPDTGVRSSYQSPLFKGIKKAILGAFFIHFAVFGLLFITLSLFNEELSALLGGNSSNNIPRDTQSVEVLMINMQNMQIEGKQTLLIEKTVNKNNVPSTDNLNDADTEPNIVKSTTVEPVIENQQSELSNINIGNVQNIEPTQATTLQNLQAKTETETQAIAKPQSKHTESIKQTKSIKQVEVPVKNTFNDKDIINKKEDISKTEVKSSSIHKPEKVTKDINKTALNNTALNQTTNTKPVKEMIKTPKIQEKSDTVQKKEKKREERVQTKSPQPQPKKAINSSTESSANSLNGITKSSNNSNSTALHPASDSESPSQPSMNANPVNTNNAAKPIKRIQPIYPNRARALNQEGVVEVMFDVNNSGKLENIRILSANPKNVFEEEVRRALRKWQYERKASKDMRITINFRLDGIGLQ